MFLTSYTDLLIALVIMAIYRCKGITTYPRLLGDDRRFSIFAKSSAAIMHHASVIIRGSQRVSCSSVVRMEIKLVS